MRHPYPASPNAKVPLFALADDVDLDRLNFSRVLFLDFDGVLHPESGDPDMQFCFSPNFCQVLQSVWPRGDVPVVISSTWRMTSTIQEMRENFPVAMHHQIVGVTPDLDVIWEPRAHMNRQTEIEAWMRDICPQGDWLAIDDRRSLFDSDCRNLFLVPPYRPGCGAGLHPETSAELETVLKGFSNSVS